METQKMHSDQHECCEAYYLDDPRMGRLLDRIVEQNVNERGS